MRHLTVVLFLLPVFPFAAQDRAFLGSTGRKRQNRIDSAGQGRDFVNAAFIGHGLATKACSGSSTNIDVRHNLVANGVYELPFCRNKPFLTSGPAAAILGGWQLAGIVTARTGLPVNITMSRKAAALPDGNMSSQRPNLVPACRSTPLIRPFTTGLTPQPFRCRQTEPGETLGATLLTVQECMKSTPRFKRFPVGERLASNFRAAAYNLFNHPIYTTPSSNIGSLTVIRLLLAVASGRSAT